MKMRRGADAARAILVTTPNQEHNPLQGMTPGEFREADHTFKWDWAKFRHWCTSVARRRL